MKYIVIIIISSILLFTACDNDNSACLKSAGDITTVRESLNSFYQISIDSDFRVILCQSDSYSVEIKGGKNLLPFVEYSSVGGKFSIENTNKCNWLRNYEQIEVKLFFPTVSEININQACDLISEDTLNLRKISIDNWAGIFNCDLIFQSDSVFLRSHASTGEWKVKGNAHFAFMYNIGSSFFYARDFKLNTLRLAHKSFRDSEIYCDNLLMIENIQYGKVYAYSCPDYIDFGTENVEQYFVNLGCP